MTYPHEIALIARHVGVSPADLAHAYVAVLGEVTHLWMADSKEQRGTRDDLYRRLAEVGPNTHFFAFAVHGGARLVGNRDQEAWNLEVTRDGAPDQAWIAATTRFARAAITAPGFVYAAVERRGGNAIAFVPRPPLARSFHAVTTNEPQVMERYDDPAVFWRVWENIERIGDVRLCTRHLDAVEEEDWLARSFDDTMDLVRHSRPRLTYYADRPHWHPPFAPWWEPGDYQDEKAGMPALTLAGYDANTKTIEYAGDIVPSSPQARGDEPLHVQITEIYAIRALVAGGRTDDGRPVAAVRVAFREEWMARQERRPLLDAGTRVFYRDAAGQARELTD